MNYQEMEDHFFNFLDKKLSVSIAKRDLLYEELCDFDIVKTFRDEKWITNQAETQNGYALEEFYCLTNPDADNLNKKPKSEKKKGIDIVVIKDGKRFAVQCKTSSNDENSSSSEAGDRNLIENAKLLQAIPVKASFKPSKNNPKIKVIEKNGILHTYGEGTAHLFNYKFEEALKAIRNAWIKIRNKYNSSKKEQQTELEYHI